MKHLLYISILLLFSLTVSAQRKHLIKDGEIIQSGIPEKFTKADDTFYWGGYKTMPDSVHYADGWREEVRPVINTSLQRYGQRYYNEAMDKVTWVVTDKTKEELAAEKENLLESIEQNFDVAAIKKLLIILTKDILDSPEVSEEQLEAIATIYPQYRVGKSYELNEVFVSDTILYKVVQAHTSQADWLPETTPALYTKYTPPGQVADWVQPTGTQDAYQIGDKVLFNGSTYESIINDNVWSPTAYPAGWKEI